MAYTEPSYRLWSINDRYSAMVRVTRGRAPVAGEIWPVPVEGLVFVLEEEPPGLTIGKGDAGDGSRGAGCESGVCPVFETSRPAGGGANQRCY